MSSHNEYAAASFPKEEPFGLRIRNVMAVWLFSVAHTSKPPRRGEQGLPLSARALCLPREPFVCPGSFF
jgi:hypothetical protein